MTADDAPPHPADGAPRIVLASNNAHKLAEIGQRLGPAVRVIAPRTLGEPPEPEEWGERFAVNAAIKAVAFAAWAGIPALADDSGLEVDALGGAPGVHSARFAGPDASDEENNRLLLERLAGVSARGARFRCVLALAWPVAEGEAIEAMAGSAVAGSAMAGSAVAASAVAGSAVAGSSAAASAMAGSSAAASAVAGSSAAASAVAGSSAVGAELANVQAAEADRVRTLAEVPDEGACVVRAGGLLWRVTLVPGAVSGEIARDLRGRGGFGYDPLFALADGRRMAELSGEEKAAVSHRGAALAALRSSGVLASLPAVP